MQVTKSAATKEVVTLECTVIRANGKVENLGIIARSHPTRWQRFIHFLRTGKALGTVKENLP